MDKIKLKKYFDKWRRQVPQDKKMLDINEGAEILKYKKNKLIIIKRIKEKRWINR